MKKLALQDLKDFRDSQRIPISDEQLEENPYLPPYYHPGPEAAEIRYLLDRRRGLGGFLPERRTKSKVLTLPGRDTYKALKKGSGTQEVATTMAMVRTFKELLRDKEIGHAHRADHPRRGPHVRDGLVVPEPEDLQPQRPALHGRRRRADVGVQGKRDRPDPARGHQRGGLDGVVHRGGHVLRHPQRADDPGLHLLFDVRVPAHRRRPVGGGRPDGPRLRAGRHRRPHHADR